MISSNQALGTRASRRRALAYVILLAASLLMLSVSRTPPMIELRRGLGYALTPMQSTLTNATRAATSVFGTLAELERVRADNQRLAQRVQGLEAENQRLESVRIQNEQLTRLLEVRSSAAYRTVPGEVIGRAAIDSERIVTIDQGTDRGVREGDVVITNGAALVGRVSEVGPNFSRVLLISDTRSLVVGLLQSSRATGDVQGQLTRSLTMSRIPAAEAIQVGEGVVTAGIDLGNGIRSPYPKGLLIGTVVDVKRDPNDVVQTAFLNPAAALDKLEYVLVITDPGPGAGPDASPDGSPGATSPAAPSGAPTASPGASAGAPIASVPPASGGPRATPAPSRPPATP